MMRYFSLALLCLIATLRCVADTEPDSIIVEARSSYEEMLHDFGEIGEHDGCVSHVFTCTNAGKAPLVIYGVSCSCECTTAEFPQSAIPPGETGNVIVSYNPKGHIGEFHKTVVVKSNGVERFVRLSVSGIVRP